VRRSLHRLKFAKNYCLLCRLIVRRCSNQEPKIIRWPLVDCSLFAVHCLPPITAAWPSGHLPDTLGNRESFYQLIFASSGDVLLLIFVLKFQFWLAVKFWSKFPKFVPFQTEIQAHFCPPRVRGPLGSYGLPSRSPTLGN